MIKCYQFDVNLELFFMTFLNELMVKFVKKNLKMQSGLLDCNFSKKNSINNLYKV